MKNSLLFIALFLLLINLNFISACMSFPQVETKKGNLSINSYNDSEISKDLEYYNSNNKFNLSEEDKNILVDFIKNGYSVKEQNDNEYKLFLKQAKKSKKKWFCGEYYSAVARKGDWTGYVTSQKVMNRFGFPCKIAQSFKCGGGYANILWNDLVK